jgi:TonB-dependent starch-binding outer membrane protein SusC
MAVVRRFLLALVVGLICSVRLGAQAPTGIISGRVIDAQTQQPVADVAVVVEGTRRGVVTSADGSFTIVGVPAGAQTVRVRRIGYAAPVQVVNVVAGSTAAVVFGVSRQAAVLEQVVTTGYGTQRRLAITGSVSTIDADAARTASQTNVTNLIEGRATGVQLTQNSGEPGAGAQILIRGGTSISASNQPLYVVDGVPLSADESAEPGGAGIMGPAPLPRNPMNLINPSDIQSITILKDAAATAIYGARAANGVILIETKKGGVGGPTVEYEVQAGMSSPKKRLALVSGPQYRDFIAAQVALGNILPVAITAQGTENTNWQDELFHTAPTINHNLSFSGGSPNTQYRASLNYFNQQGIVINNGLRRYQARVNGTHNAMEGRLRLALNLTGSHIINDYLPYEENGGFEGGVFINMVNFNPTHPVTVTDAQGVTRFYEIGTGAQSVRNPVALANQVLDKGTSDRTLGNMSTDFDIFQSLTARVALGVDRTAGDRNAYLPRASAAGAIFNGLAQRANRDNTTKTIQTLLTFHPTFTSSRELDVVGGYEFGESTFNEFGVQTRNYLTDAFTFNSLGSGIGLEPPYSNRSDRKLVSFFGRANLGFSDKYFLTGVIRRDGSSAFGEGNKWAVFPAISGSWRLNQESFMKTGPFSELRLRAGWGKQGNEAVAPYSSLILLAADGGSRYAFGDRPVTGVTPIRNPNPNLKWEETAQTNFALDYGFLNNRLNGSLEYYVKNTKDLLLEINVPQPAVVETRLENIGRMRNKGIELSLDGLVLQRPEMNVSAGFVFSHDKNEVIDLGGKGFIPTAQASGQGQSNQFTQRIMPGQPLGTFWGPEFVGFDAGGHQLFNSYTINADGSRTIDGQVQAKDLSSNDDVILGNAFPDYSLGLRTNGNWKKFDFSLLINRVSGGKIFNNTRLVYEQKGNALQDKNFLEAALTDPSEIHEPAKYSSRYIEDGTYTRLQNITVGWTFDLPSFTGTARNSRVFLSADNLALWTNYSGYDPEVHTQLPGLAPRGIDYLHYPRGRTFTGGLRVAF